MEGWSGYKHPDPPYWLHWTDGVYLSYRIPAREMVKADSVSLHEDGGINGCRFCFIPYSF